MAVQGSGAGDDQGNDAQDGFDAHRTVADEDGIRFFIQGLRRRAGRNEAVEARHSTAGDGDEEDREEILAADGEGREGRHVQRRLRDEDADDAAGDHHQEQESADVVTRLFEEPHRHDRREEDVGEDDVEPGHAVEVNRQVDAHIEHGDQEDDGNDEADLFTGIEFLDEQAEGNGDEDEEHGNRSRCGIRQDHRAVLGKAVEGRGDDIAEGSDNEEAEDPAEKQEETAARRTDVLFDEDAHGFAVILHGCIKSGEVLDGTEEDAADHEP